MVDDSQRLLKLFFQENDYIVRVCKVLNSNGCIASFPSNFMIDPPSLEDFSLYLIEEDGVGYMNGKNSVDTIISCPRYAARMLIFQDILFETLRLNIPLQMITFYDDEDNELEHNSSLVDILEAPTTSDEQKLEDKLADIFYKSYPTFIEDLTPLAKEKGVEEGYKALRQIHIQVEFDEQL